MLFVYTESFSSDRKQLQQEHTKLLSKLFDLLDDIQHTPYIGIGKPEPLKGNFTGYWSRRITDKHRLIYKIEGDIIHLISCYGHYGDK